MCVCVYFLSSSSLHDWAGLSWRVSSSRQDLFPALTLVFLLQLELHVKDVLLFSASSIYSCPTRLGSCCCSYKYFSVFLIYIYFLFSPFQCEAVLRSVLLEGSGREGEAMLPYCLLILFRANIPLLWVDVSLPFNCLQLHHHCVHQVLFGGLKNP